LPEKIKFSINLLLDLLDQYNMEIFIIAKQLSEESSNGFWIFCRFSSTR